MHNVQLVQILNACYYLVEEFDSQRFLNTRVFYYKVKELATLSILHNQV